ncbi:MAG: hypothetical protein ACPGU1_13210 [Myxococcota bacterium]
MLKSLQLFTLAAVGLTLVASPVAAEGRDQRVVAKEMLANELLKTYRTDIQVGENTSQIHQGQVKHPLLKLIHSDCSRGVESCEASWKALAGKPMEGVGQVFFDALDTNQWTGPHGCAGSPQVCGPSGENWSFTIEGPHTRARPKSAVPAAKGLVLYPVEGAAARIAATIETEKKQGDLWQEYVAMPYEALYYMGAKDQLGAILKGLTFNARNKERSQVKPTLLHLPAWSLAPEQVEQIASFCVELFSSTDENNRPIAACIRYLGMVETTHEDAREFIANYANGQGDSWLHLHGIRAAAGLALKDAKENLQGNLKKAYREKTLRIRKGKKRIEKKVDTWSAHHQAVPSAVALMGMKDKQAAKAVAYWLSFEERGGSEQFVHNQGFRLLAREANFADPKTKKKLLKLLSKAWKKAAKLAESQSGMERDVFQAALGLSQLGDKAAVDLLVSYIKGKKGRESDIREIFKAWGGDTKAIMHGGNSNIGIGHLTVGKTGVPAKLAQSVADVIVKRMKFWSDKNTKGLATNVVLDLKARIAGAANGL